MELWLTQLHGCDVTCAHVVGAMRDGGRGRRVNVCVLRVCTRAAFAKPGLQQWKGMGRAGRLKDMGMHVYVDQDEGLSYLSMPCPTLQTVPRASKAELEEDQK